jgi:PmbA protein
MIMGSADFATAASPAFSTATAAQQVLDALRRQGFEHAQVSVADTRAASSTWPTTSPACCAATKSRKLSATGIVDGRRASAEGSDLSADGVARWSTAVDQRPLGAARRGQRSVVGPAAAAVQGPARSRPPGPGPGAARLLAWRAEHTPTMMIEEALAAHVRSRWHTLTTGGSVIDCDWAGAR